MVPLFELNAEFVTVILLVKSLSVSDVVLGVLPQSLLKRVAVLPENVESENVNVESFAVKNALLFVIPVTVIDEPTA